MNGGMGGFVNIYRHIPDLATLEREYSPSSCVSDLSALLSSYGTRSAHARAQFPHLRTLCYGADAAETIDFFPVHDCPDAPLLVFIHGGYWQELSKNDASFPAVDCHRNGIAYAAVNYGLAPSATLPQMIERCRLAVAALYESAGQLGFDRSSIYLSGSSAGAHLAAMTMLADWRASDVDPAAIRGAILLSGVFELEPLVSTYVNTPLRLTTATARLLSPLLQLENSSVPLPPVLVAYGEHETSEFKRQSTQFASALTGRTADVQLLQVAGRNHFDVTFDMVDERTTLGKTTLSFIARSRKPGGTS